MVIAMCEDYKNISELIDKLSFIMNRIRGIDKKYVSIEMLNNLTARNEVLIDNISSLTDECISIKEKSRMLSVAVDIRIALSEMKQKVMGDV